MTKNEALKAAIDGKKVYFPNRPYGTYIYWNGQQFMLASDCGPEVVDFSLFGYDNDRWVIVPEYVDFATAWAAYEEGKTIQDAYSNLYRRKEEKCKLVEFSAYSIRDKWLILEDELL